MDDDLQSAGGMLGTIQMAPSKKKNGQKSIFWDYHKKNPVSGRAMVRGKMLHFVAFFVHFDKLIRPHPGPLCPPPFFCLIFPNIPNCILEVYPAYISALRVYFSHNGFETIYFSMGGQIV